MESEASTIPGTVERAVAASELHRHAQLTRVPGSIARPLLVGLASAVIAGFVIHAAASNYVVNQAEERVRDVLLTQRGLHRYIQEVMHPEYYGALRGGKVRADYYSPKVLSSTYMARRIHAFYNEERQRQGLEPIYYKLAADNPRDPRNQADELELATIRRFNAERSDRERRELVTIEGKQYLQVSIPFLPNNAACLTCHGRPEDAPPGLQALYPGPGGFNELAGRIRAVETIRVPIQAEQRLTWVVSGGLGFGVLCMTGLFLFNGRLRRSVEDRTRALQLEMRERVDSETQVHQLKDALQRVVDAMPSALVGLDEEGRVTLWNAHAERLSGRAAAEAMGLALEEAMPDLATPLAELRASAGPEPSSREQVLLETEGKRHYLDLLHYPLAASGGRGAVIRIDDVTDRVLMTYELAQAQRIEAIGTLAGGIAHDFNNILSAIAGHIELALERPLDAELRTDLESVRDAARRATELTRQILTFSRHDRQDRRPVELAGIVREAVKLLRASTPATIEIRTRLDSAETVFADPTDLHRVVVNLCTNAARAMPEGGLLEVAVEKVMAVPAAASSAAGAAPTCHLRLSVRDNGIGMTPDVLARIFEPFFTTGHARGGTGMGLAMVHGIVTKMGGRISVRSEPGKGSTFDVLLLCQGADVVTAVGETSAAPSGTERVLFLDDEKVICHVVARGLERLGYRVTTFTAPATALATFEADPSAFDVVITDMTMPGLTGDVVAHRVKQRRPDLPVIVCTGFSERMTAERSKDLGINLFVLKPVVAADLSRMIRTVVGQAS